MKRYYPQLKRSAFLILLLIVAYYVRRDLPAVLAHPELLRGLAIIFLVGLSGVSVALAAQFHKENQQLKKKLGEENYNWLIRGK